MEPASATGGEMVGETPGRSSLRSILNAPSRLRIRDVAVYLRVSHQRVTQMYARRQAPRAGSDRRRRAAVEAGDG
jgi:hypothetical protein